MQQEYNYRPLVPGNIRLVTIAPGSWEDDVYFTIEQQSPSDVANHYDCLSYTWGDPVDLRRIYCQTSYTCLNVTTSCQLAMRRLRLLLRPRRVWIDAVCINQHDLSERAQQVSIMGEIYKRARAVVIYLGEEADRSSDAMNYLNEIRLQKASWSTPLAPNLMSALAALIARPWFSRIWVLQELFNAASATIVCGSCEAPWAALDIYKWWHILGRRDIDRWPFVTTIKDRSVYYSTDLLGLLLVALHLARHDLQFLAMVSHNPDSLAAEAIPSWVPEWDFDDGCVPIWPSTGKAIPSSPQLTASGDILHKPGEIQEQTNYKAGGLGPVIPEVIRGVKSILKVRGIRIGEISDLSPVMFTTAEDLALSKGDFFLTWTSLRRNYKGAAVWETSRSLHPIHHSIDAVMGHPMWKSTTTQYNRTWQHDVVGVTNGRRIFVADRDRMGIVPALAQVGDVLCIFLGCPVPIVLRLNKNEGGLKFVGPCYVNRLMMDNAIDILREELGDAFALLDFYLL
ncbi:heterokaryon incompatibility protein-domain-containing protein [Leptodontidium sp. MPI-SDFR-AT-0119]|nr:heterokaryon incompatibility protein-domain-containing protein [Leptodontidium sp. MPI-SDFR-AT-0119]